MRALQLGRRHARHPPEDRERLAGRQVAREAVPLGEVADAAAALGIGDGQAEEARARPAVG